MIDDGEYISNIGCIILDRLLTSKFGISVAVVLNRVCNFVACILGVLLYVETFIGDDS